MPRITFLQINRDGGKGAFYNAVTDFNDIDTVDSQRNNRR